MKKDPSKVPPEKLTAYERWELPVMGGSQGKNRPSTAKLPTAAELQAIQKTAYKEGFLEGKQAGQKAGFDQGHQQGLQAGMEEGLKQGTAQGKIEAMAAKQAEIDTQIQQLEQVMNALQLPLKEVKDQAEEAVVNLVLAVSRAVVYRELQLERQQITSVVSEALAALPISDEQAIVYIHPKDLEFLQVKQPAEKDFRYVADPLLMVGGCRVETRHSLLDFTVEKRFQTVVQQMLSGQSSHADDPDAHDFSEQMGEMTDFHRNVLESSPVGSSEKPAKAEKEQAKPSEPRPSVAVVADNAPGTEAGRATSQSKKEPARQVGSVDSAHLVDTAVRERTQAGKASDSSGDEHVPLKSHLGGLDDG